MHCIILIFPISDVFVGPNPSEMSRETAFRIFPIVHQYGMRLILGWCVNTLERGDLDLWPSEPIPSSEVLNHPGLVQCLALADAKQCDSLVQSCVSQLVKQGSSNQMIRKALISPDLNRLLASLRPETKDKIIVGLAGLPMDFTVCGYLNRAAALNEFHLIVFFSLGYH